MKKKGFKLKKWFERLNCWNLGLWFVFVATTIDNILTYPLYDKIFVLWTLLALASFYLLFNYSNVFESE